MLKLSGEILPLIDYTFSAKWYPESTESREYISFELLQQTQSYSDFTSSIYDHPNPCTVVNKKPLYVLPSELNFAKAYIDWIYNQKGAKRKDFRSKIGSIERVLLLQFQLELPLVSKFIDPDYWLNTEVIIPTYYVDIETEKRMCFKCRSLILTNYSINISVDKVNTVSCTVFGFNPELIFLDYVPSGSEYFDNWISKTVEVHSYPDDINLVSQNILFSATISQSTNTAFNSYKEPLQMKEIWYVYIPNPDGTFKRLNGFVNLSDYALDFDTYDWMIIQSHPQFNVNLELFDPKHSLSRLYASTFQINFKNETGGLLGTISIYPTDLSFEMFRVQISGYGEYIPGDV